MSTNYILNKKGGKQCITYNVEPENLSELTMHFIDTFNKQHFKKLKTEAAFSIDEGAIYGCQVELTLCVYN